MELNIQTIIDARRRAAEEAHRERIKDIEQKFPEYKKLTEEIAEASLGILKAKLGGDEKLAEDLSHKMKSFAQKKKEILTQNGLAENYDEPKYSCSLCEDTGIANGERCSCYRQLRAEALYENSGIKDALKAENFQTFDMKYFDRVKVDPSTGKTSYDNMQSNLKIAKEVASLIGKSMQNLLFSGASGTGKTFLSNCIAGEVLKRGYSVVYQPATSFFDKMAKGRFGENPEERKEILTCDLLVIDDLGTEFNNALVSSVLFETLNERILTKKSTIISTNLGLNQIRDSYSERVSSRILEHYKVCRFFNPDIRLIKRRESYEKR